MGNPGCTADLLTNEFANVAPGHGDPHAAPYAGHHHPMVFIDAYSAEEQLLKDEYPNIPSELAPAAVTDVQLVALFPQSQTIRTSCGTYMDEQNGTTGTLFSQATSQTVTIVAARTGQVVATQTFTAPGYSCSTTNVYVGVGPPWMFPAPNAPEYGQDNALTAWINGFLTGRPV